MIVPNPLLAFHLGQSSRSVALVRLDNLAASNLLISISRPDDLTGLIVDNREGGEAIALTELAAPARGDGVMAAVDGTTVGLGGRAALHDIGAGSGITGAGVDAKGPGAGGVCGVTDTLGVLDGPLGAGSHHGLAGGGSSKGRGGQEAGSEEELGELHDERLS